MWAGLPQSSLPQNPDRICFSSGAQTAGLNGLFAFVFVLTFSYFQDVAFREEKAQFSLPCVLRWVVTEHSLLCGQRPWNLVETESADCDRPLGHWRPSLWNRKTVFLMRCLELPNSQGYARQKHDPCYPALPRVTGEFTSPANQRHSQPDESVELPGLRWQYLAHTSSAFKFGDCTSNMKGCREPWNVLFDEITHGPL